MRNLVLSLLLFCVPYVSLADSAETAGKNFPLGSKTVDVGAVYQFGKVSTHTRIQNTGQVAVKIGKIVARLPTVDSNVLITNTNLTSGQSVDIEIQFQAPERVGGMSKVFDVYAENSDVRLGIIVVRGFVDWIVEPSSLDIDLGIWRVRDSLSKSVSFKTRPGANLRLTRLLSESKTVDVTIVNDGKGLSIRGRKSVPWGPIQEVISVETSSKEQTKVVFHLRGEARGTVVPSSYMAAFDPVREGESPEQIVKLIDEAGGRLNLGDVKAIGTEVGVAILDCSPKAENCKQVAVKLPPQKLGSPPRGVVKVDLPDYRQTIPIYYGGTVIGKNTQIRNLEEEIEKAKDAPVSISSLLKSTVHELPPVEMSLPNGSGPLISWQVTNESSVYGYEIYRGTSETGDFSRVYDKIIKRLDAQEGQTSIYRWRDLSALRGREYWYYIGIAYMNGEKKALTNPQKIIAK